MAAATVTAHLTGGLQIGDVVHTEAEIREANAADFVEAQVSAEKLVMVPEGNGFAPQLVISPTLIALEMLARRVVRIGDHPGPLTLKELKKLKKAEDIAILQSAADNLDNAALRPLVAEVENRGRGAAGTD